MTGKRAAGQAAAGLVEDGMRVGFGTGSTVAEFLDALAARDLDVTGLATSLATEARCHELGIAVLGPGEVDRLDLVVDGADELTRDLALTKGGGGALLREKVVAELGERFVVIATQDKLVARLGSSFPLPVEVVPFAVPSVTARLRALGGDPVAREDGEYRTDNGNAILDVAFEEGIEDVDVLGVTLALIPGVVEHGLFVELADEALLGADDGSVSRLTR